DRRQALLLALAKTRGCSLELMLRNPDAAKDETYSIDKVEKLLTNSTDPANIVDESEGGTDPKKPSNDAKGPAVVKTTPDTTGVNPAIAVEPVARPTVEVVRVPVAVESIPV